MTEELSLSLCQMLQQDVDAWELLGHSNILARFVLRNGRTFTPTKRIGRKRKAKQCFKNSADFVLTKGGTYVEGYAINKKFPIMPIHHAWVTMGGEDAMDLTLDADGYDYFGIPFDTDTLRREIVRNNRYCLLDPGFGINAELIFKRDPELLKIVEAVKANYKPRRHETEKDHGSQA